MDDLSVSDNQNGAVTVVTISGRVDSATAGTLDAKLNKILHQHNKLVLDLKGVIYLSSAGVRSIVRSVQNAQKANGGVKLAAMPGNVKEVLETVGMLDRVQAYPSVDEAVASF